MNAVLALVRPYTLLAPAVGVASGALVAHAAGAGPVDGPALALGILAAVLATAASNAWNQAFDVEIDRVNRPERPLVTGALGVRFALGAGTVAALAAAGLAALAAPRYLVFVLAGLGLTWIYSAPPVRAKASWWGALLSIAVARGVLVPVAGWALVAPARTAEPWYLGGVLGLFVLGAAVTKDFADVEGDRAHGCATLPVLLGPRVASRCVAPFLVVPFLFYPVGSHAGLLRPEPHALWILGGLLAGFGAITAASLLRASRGSAPSGSGRVPWAAMYFLMLGAHVGTAVAYLLAT